LSETDPTTEQPLENLLAEFSTRVLIVSPDEVDRTIVEALGRVCDSLSVEAALIWHWAVGSPDLVELTHLHNPSGIALPPGRINVQDYFPWTHQQIMAGRPAVIPSVDEMPPEAAHDQEVHRGLGARSSVILPLAAWGSPFIGVLALIDTRSDRPWPETTVETLRSFAQSIADALARRTKETARGESEARLAVAIDIAGLGFYETGEGGRVIFLDSRARAILGLHPGEDQRAREHWIERMHPEDRENVLEVTRDLWAGIQDRANRQYRYQHPSLGLRWIDHFARVVARDVSGRSTHMLSVLQDITDRKHAETTLRRLAERYDAITSSTNAGFWEIDGDGKLLSVNDEACRMLGYRREELLSLPISAIDADFSPEEIRSRILRVRAIGQTRFEARHRRKNGSILMVEISARHSSTQGTILLFLRDITEQKRWEQQLRESLDFNRTILASMVDNIAILDRDGVIVAINDAWEGFALAHGGPEVLATAGVGVNYLDVCRRSEAVAALEGIESVLRGSREKYQVEYTMSSPNGLDWYLMEVTPLRRERGGAVVIHRDITSQRKDEEELERLRVSIWHAHRVEQTGAITASLAHELNQPLAAILSNSQAGLRLLSDPSPDLDEIRAILADIVSDDKRAASVIAGLRAMMRRQETQREPLDLAATLTEVMALVRSELLNHEVAVELRADASGAISADRAQIQQVILNLVMNAIEAMEVQPPERRRLAISITRTNEGDTLLAVRDSGRGIPDDEQARVFDAFWSTKPQGMGIGLAICRSIVESHGGNLWFESSEDRGTTFFVSLPAGRLSGTD
jgi:PAS domain S-box-containing protein